MRRLIERYLNQWKDNTRRKPLILQGARQTGKTYVLQEFGKRAFKMVHYFDLEESYQSLIC